eukprot:COSAG03_NODE_16577_length_397_cov_1.563758_1_plen_50_part_10
MRGADVRWVLSAGSETERDRETDIAVGKDSRRRRKEQDELSTTLWEGERG